MTTPDSSGLRYWLVCAAMWPLFAFAFGANFLYHSNQNTKFLQGLARAFPERLGGDWTSTTVDGLPVFSALVFAVARYAHPQAFYVIEAVLLGVMLASLVALARIGGRSLETGAAFMVVVASVFVILAGNVQEESLRGVAGQYMTRAYLQPSEFGVLFLPALLLAYFGSRVGMVLAAIPAVLHPNYIAVSAILVGAMLYCDWRSGRRLISWQAVVAAIMIVGPPIDLAFRFAPSDPESFARANQILAFGRIPQHSDPLQWADFGAMSKLVWAVIGAMVAPKGVLRVALIGLTAYAVIGAGVVAVTGNAEIALIAPWRASVLTTPLALALCVGALVAAGLKRTRWAWPVAGVLAAIAVVIGGQGVIDAVEGWKRSQPAAHVLHVRETSGPGNVYLTNPDDYEFRLEAMAPQFVTWKTHPYLDVEVLEWDRRVNLARNVFTDGVDCVALDALLAEYEVSHLVLEDWASEASPCPRLAPEFASESGAVFAVSPS